MEITSSYGRNQVGNQAGDNMDFERSDYFNAMIKDNDTTHGAEQTGGLVMRCAEVSGLPAWSGRN